jgi:hypothetical protein
MGYRGRIYFTEKQKAEIWDRWQRGESMSSIGRRGIVTLSGIGPVWTINQQAKSLKSALSEQNSKYLERPSNRSDRSGKMQENQWPRNPVLTFWQSERICSDNALQTSCLRRSAQVSLTMLAPGTRSDCIPHPCGRRG